MRKTSKMPQASSPIQLVDDAAEPTGTAVELWDSAVRIDAALAAFDRLVAEIDGATVLGQSLIVDGRVFIDLSDADEDLLAA